MLLSQWTKFIRTFTTLARQQRSLGIRRGERRRNADGWLSRGRGSAEVCEERIMLSAGPIITAVTPLQVQNAAFDHIDIDFDSSIDAATFTTDDVSITGPVGSSAVTITGVSQLDADSFRVSFAPFATRGTYTAVIGPNIADTIGRLMDQDDDNTAGETIQDRFTTSLVYINANAIFTSSVTIGESDTTYEGLDLLINGKTVAINGPHSFNSIHIINGGVLTHTGNTTTQTHKLDATVADQVIIDSTSRIDVSGKGYLPGRTTGNTTVGAATGNAGGSYGGSGGGGSAASNAVYGDYADPEDWGSGSAENAGGAGGGLVRITTDRFTLDGRILAQGLENHNGGASGGGVYVAVTTLEGTGSINAAGAPGSFGGGGGGGRVAVYANNLSNFTTSHITAAGGLAYYPTNGHGGAGSVYIRDPGQARGSLIFDSVSIAAGWTPLGLPDQTTLVIPDDVILRGASNVRLEHAGMAFTVQGTLEVQTSSLLQVDDAMTANGVVTVSGGSTLSATGGFMALGSMQVIGATLIGGLIVAPSLSVSSNSVLTSPGATTTQTYRLELQISEVLTVDSTSRIDVSGKGYLPGRTTGNTTVGAATGNAGGSYGGSGGGGSAASNAVYGDYADPEDWGSGSAENAGGAGGGLVRITTDRFTLDGRILAQGLENHNGGASGGGVYVAVTTLEGTGSINAAGAPGSFGGGGGGGRVAVYAHDLSNFTTGQITAAGGLAYYPTNGHGGAGTVYILQGASHTHVRLHGPAGATTGFVGKGNGLIPARLDSITLKFNKPIDLAIFTPSVFEISGQMGRIVPTSMTLVGNRTYRIGLPFPLTENGTYRFRLLPTIKDQEGFFLDQDADGIPGEPSDDVYEFDLTVDTVPPRIAQHTPAGDISGTISSVDVFFSEAIDKATFTTSDVTIIRPDTTTVAASSITEVGFNRFRIAFPAQTLVGQYRVKVGPDIRDPAGNKLDQDRDGIFGEAVQDIYNADFNLVQVDLALSNLVVGASQLWAGEPVFVSWNGVNATGAALLGNWTDAVYLSTDDKWDINDVRLATIDHTGGLAAGASYSGSTTINVPGKLPGNYRILVRADVANQERETNETNNLVASPVIPFNVRSLVTTGAVVNGSLNAADRSDFYRIELAGGDSLKLKLNAQAPGSQTELYVSYAGIPSRVSFDQRSSVPGIDQEISLKAINGGGVYYVLVYGSQIPGSMSYTISASKAPVFLSGITPTRYGLGSTATVTITGVGFDETTTVEFFNAAGFLQPVPVQFISSTTLTTTVGLDTASLGTFSVRVTKNGASVELLNAFQLVTTSQAKLETNVVVPGNVSPGFPIKQTLWVEYRNTGNIAMPAPLLQVYADGNSLLTTDENLANTVQSLRTLPNGIGGSVQLFGIGSSATPGLLQPGESGRLPVYYLGLSKDLGRGQVNFSLGSLSALDTTEKVAYFQGPDERVVWQRPGHGARNIDTNRFISPEHAVRIRPAGSGPGPVGFVIPRYQGWTFPPNVFEEYLVVDGASIRTSGRPASVSSDAWGAIVYHLHQTYGDLWADYVTAMSNTANYLASVGQVTSSVGALWGFEVAQASAALNPVRYLAGAVDASVAAPGLPLTFSRVFGQDIASRFKMDTMGRGWTHNWGIEWSSNDEGDITLHGPGGTDRFFTKNKNGTYLASLGDYGKLTLTSGVYKLVETDQTVWQFRTDGRLDFVADPNNNRITLGYSLGLVTSVTHSNGRQLLLNYSGDFGMTKLLSSVTDTMGPGTADDRVTTYEYDSAREHLMRVIAPGNRVTEYSYEGVTQVPLTVRNSKGGFVNIANVADPRSHALLSVTYSDGTHDYFSYDSRGRLTETQKDGNTERVTFSYPSAGGVNVVDANGRTTQLKFGIGGQLVQVRDADGRTAGFGYDSKSQFSQLSGPGGEQYRYTYDAKGNVTGIRDALNLQTSFSYETSFNQLAGFTDARGNGINYQYDAKANLTRITYADLSSEVFTHDAVGNVTSTTNRRSQVVTYGYNSAGQVTQKDDVATAGIDFTYSYDVAGNLISATDSGGVNTMTYDPVTDRLTRIDYPGGKFFTFDYDIAGRRRRRTDQSGNIENYVYDSIGRLDRMTSAMTGLPTESLIVDYDYDPTGRLSRKSLGNGVYTTYAYDTAGNIQALVNLKEDGTVLSRFDYEYDVSGRRTAMTTVGGRFEYRYDAIGQLVSVKHPDQHVVVYDYDEAGNRRQVIDDGVATAYTTNNLNQYTQVGGVTYAFDADGNLISQTENGVTTTYAYNIENRLIGVTNPTDTWTYAYDALGNRVASTHNGQTTRYVIDPTGLGNLAAEYDGSGNLIARYNHGYGLLSRNDGTDPAFYTFQAIGHTSEMTGTGGTLLNSYEYDPFGVSLGKTEVVANPFEYVGEYGVMNEGNELEFMRARYYTTEPGRFTQQDPIGIGGGMNLYAYCENANTVAVDPSGLLEFYPFPWSDETTNLDMSIDGDDIWELAKEGIPKLLEQFHSSPAGQLAEVILHYWPKAIDEAIQNYPIIEPYVDAIIDNYIYYYQQYIVAPFWQTVQALAWLARSRDPNDKLAPTGYGESAFIQTNASLAYTVRFENQSDATAPAREVIITDVLDTDLDLDTFELTEIAFADQRLPVPAGLSHYTTTVAMLAGTTPIHVEVTADLDRDTRQLTLLLRSVDPVTGWSPEDPLVGLLYPNDATSRGEGSISYRIAPLPELPSGTRIENRARIYFDLNDPIDTPLVFNTLDALAPTSTVHPLSATNNSTTFTLVWSGQDESLGSGIATYDIYVSMDGGAYNVLVDNTTETSTSLTGEPGHTYAFYSIATDNVGHIEAAPVTPDAVTSTPLAIKSPPPLTTDMRPLIEWTPVFGAVSYDVWINNQTVGSIPVQQFNVTDASFTPTIDLGIGSFALWVRSVNAGGEKSPWIPRYDFRIATPAVLQPIERLQLTVRPALRWNPLPGAVKYDLWIDNRANGQMQFVREQNLTTTSWTPSIDLPIGTYRAWIRGIDAAGTPAYWSQGIEFQVSPRASLHAMERFQATSRPTISWDEIPGAVRYDLWINNRTTGQNQFVRDVNLTTTSWTPSTDLPLSVYRAWIRGIDAGGIPASWSLAVDFTVATPPVVTSPLNSTFDRTPTFAWSAVTGATRYEVQVRNLWTGTTVHNETVITGTSWTPTVNLPDGPSRWWVIAIGANGVRGLWTAPTDIYIGGLTNLLTPTGTTTEIMPMFSWQPVDGAVRYELWVTHVELNVRRIHETNLTTLGYTPALALPTGSYRAWVRAVSSSGEVSLWSQQANFAIAAVDSMGKDLSLGPALLTKLQSVESILADSEEAIGSNQFAGKFADKDSEQVSVGEEQAHSGFEWAAPVQRFQLPIDGRSQKHSTMLQSKAICTAEAMEGSLLDALMTQFNEVDFTVGPGE